MNRFLSVVLVFAMLLCCLVGCAETTTTTPTTAPTQPAKKTKLKIMSFNIQTHANGEIFYVRAEMMRDFIAEMQPDSIGMQEVTKTWRNELDASCFGENYSSVGTANLKTGEMNPIYFRNDKFDLVDSGTFWLSDTPDVSGSKFEDSNEIRVCTWARLKDKISTLEFVHLNVHLDHTGDRASADAREVRLKQGKVLLDFVKTLGTTPMLLTGDFNQGALFSTGEYVPLYQYITGMSPYTTADGSNFTAPFADARMTAPDTVSKNEWASMVKYQVEGEQYDPSRNPIDYIFYTPSHFEPTVYRNILYLRDGLFTISDHLPQYTEFVVK